MHHWLPGMRLGTSQQHRILTPPAARVRVTFFGFQEDSDRRSAASWKGVLLEEVAVSGATFDRIADRQISRFDS